MPLFVILGAALLWLMHHKAEAAAPSTAVRPSSPPPPAKVAQRLEAIRTLPPAAVHALAKQLPAATVAPHKAAPAPTAHAPVSSATRLVPAASHTPAASLPASTAVPAHAPRTPAQAARELAKYLAAGGSPGHHSAPAEFVLHAQYDMGKIKSDGIVGPQTRARARALGSVLPPLAGRN